MGRESSATEELRKMKFTSLANFLRFFCYSYVLQLSIKLTMYALVQENLE